MSPFFMLPAAGGFFFLAAWLMMIFAGVLADDIGIKPFGYGTALVATIALWMVVAPAIGAIARARRREAWRHKHSTAE
ncbi:MAG: hypothetical protein ACRDH6_02780 [Actinomycetota bacterium]